MKASTFKRYFAIAALPYAVMLWGVLMITGADHPLPWMLAIGYMNVLALMFALWDDPIPPEPVRHCQDPDCMMCERLANPKDGGPL